MLYPRPAPCSRRLPPLSNLQKCVPFFPACFPFTWERQVSNDHGHGTLQSLLPTLQAAHCAHIWPPRYAFVIGELHEGASGVRWSCVWSFAGVACGASHPWSSSPLDQSVTNGRGTGHLVSHGAVAPHREEESVVIRTYRDCSQPAPLRSRMPSTPHGRLDAPIQ